MADDLDEEELDEGGSDDGPAKKKLGGKKLILFIILPLLLIIGGAAVAYFTGLADPLIAMITGGKKEPKHEEHKPAEHAAIPGAGAVFYDLPEMLVNLNTTGKKSSFLKIRVALELKDGGDSAQMDLVLPRIIDNFQVYLRELRVDDLRGSAGMYRLREELLARVNAAVAPAEIKDVLFKEMLVQ